MDRMPKIIRKILRTVSIVILSCTVLLAGVVFLPRLFGIVPHTVVSGSMEPTVPVGAMIYVNTNNKEPQVDDIIAFHIASNTMVTHRVVAVQGDQYVTRGDANTAQDLAPVSASKVSGVCMFHIPLLGYLFFIPAIRYVWLALALCSMICLLIVRKERTRSL